MYEWLPYPNNSLVQQIGGTSSKYFQNARSVLFHFTDNPAKDSLTKVFNQGYAGCVHFHVSWNCHMKRRAMKWLYYTVHSGRFEKIIFDLEVSPFFILTKILSPFFPKPSDNQYVHKISKPSNSFLILWSQQISFLGYFIRMYV